MAPLQHHAPSTDPPPPLCPALPPLPAAGDESSVLQGMQAAATDLLRRLRPDNFPAFAELFVAAVLQVRIHLFWLPGLRSPCLALPLSCAPFALRSLCPAFPLSCAPFALCSPCPVLPLP